MKITFKINRDLFYYKIKVKFGSTTEFVEHLGISKQALSYHVVKKGMNINTILRYSNALKLTPQEFIEVFFEIEESE